jgi:hypothetical protein
MVALNFQAQFAKAVEMGAKTRTIRAPRKDGRRPKAGDKLQLYTGMRQKGCRKLREAVCSSVHTVTIDESGVQVEGIPLTVPQAVNFARADGFTTYAEMASFFKETHGLPFSGLLIQWQ